MFIYANIVCHVRISNGAWEDIMSHTIPGGVWPTMITPFRNDLSVDYDALGPMVEWYIAHGVSGLFAVCQSSEMFYLTLDERVRLARETVRIAAGRVPVIASGHISEDPEQGLEEVAAILETGVDTAVLLTNRFGAPGDRTETWRSSLERFVARLPEEASLGFYECPYPYSRILTADDVAWLSDTGRFSFLKDTSCNTEVVCSKVKAAEQSDFRVFNANAATLLETLRCGAAGYSGVMANMHPELYAWLVANWQQLPAEAAALQDFLGTTAILEKQLYPVNAKRYMQLEGIPITRKSRVHTGRDLGYWQFEELLQFHRLSHRQAATLGVPQSPDRKGT